MPGVFERISPSSREQTVISPHYWHYSISQIWSCSDLCGVTRQARQPLSSHQAPPRRRLISKSRTPPTSSRQAHRISEATRAQQTFVRATNITLVGIITCLERHDRICHVNSKAYRAVSLKLTLHTPFPTPLNICDSSRLHAPSRL